MGAKVSISDNLDVDKILKNSSKNVQILYRRIRKSLQKGEKGKWLNVIGRVELIT